MNPSEREDIEAILNKQPADSESLIEFWSAVLRKMYTMGYSHGLANKEVPNENRTV